MAVVMPMTARCWTGITSFRVQRSLNPARDSALDGRRIAFVSRLSLAGPQAFKPDIFSYAAGEENPIGSWTACGPWKEAGVNAARRAVNSYFNVRIVYEFMKGH
jgi:hypothetical protein